MKNEENKILHLTNLLDDTDENIYSTIEKELIKMGTPALPYLKKIIDSSNNILLKNRATKIYEEIYANTIINEFETWLNQSNKNIIEGYIIISKIIFPEIDSNQILSFLNSLQNDISSTINYSATPLQIIRTINHIFFDIYNFSGITDNPNDVSNYCINKIINTRKGFPTALGIIYSYVAINCKLPVFGVNIPGIYLLGFFDINKKNNKYDASPIFFFYPIAKNNFLTHSDVENIIKKQALNPDPYKNLKPATYLETLYRLTYNIILLLNNNDTNQTNKIKILEKINAIMKDFSNQ